MQKYGEGKDESQRIRGKGGGGPQGFSMHGTGHKLTSCICVCAVSSLLALGSGGNDLKLGDDDDDTMMGAGAGAGAGAVQIQQKAGKARRTQEKHAGRKGAGWGVWVRFFWEI